MVEGDWKDPSKINIPEMEMAKMLKTVKNLKLSACIRVFCGKIRL